MTNALILIERHKALCSTSRDEDAAVIVRELEEFAPVTEREWQLLHSFFTQHGNSIWADIISARFLKHEPHNIPALLARAEYLSELRSERNEALKIVDTLTGLDMPTTAHMVKTGNLLAKYSLLDRAMPYWEAAKTREPHNVSIQASIVHALLNKRYYARAKSEITIIAGSAGDDIKTHMTALALAERLDDKAFVGRILKTAMCVIQTDDHLNRGRLIVIAARSRQPALLTELVVATDFTKIASVAELVKIQAALEGLGFHEQERRLILHGLSLEPANNVLAEGLRRQTLPLATVLHSAINDASVGQRDHQHFWRSTLDYIRGLMFWR